MTDKQTEKSLSFEPGSLVMIKCPSKSDNVLLWNKAPDDPDRKVTCVLCHHQLALVIANIVSTESTMTWLLITSAGGTGWVCQLLWLTLV